MSKLKDFSFFCTITINLLLCGCTISPGFNGNSKVTGLSSESSATEKSATSSGASAHSSCAAYAGPDSANSTCANDKGTGISTRASDNVGSNSN